ncbi:MAG TPA: hypothetical protein VL728_11740 [Cyclobacteriaceae bacterium]|nr:hypothetical protein [Cyclobacteriaceae bacterium]
MKTALGRMSGGVGRSAVAARNTRGGFDPALRALPGSNSITSNINQEVGPVILQLDPVTGKLDPSILQFDPTVGQFDPSNLPLDPSVGQIDPSILPLDPSVGQIDPSILQLDPSVGQLDPSDGSIEPMAGAKAKPLKSPPKPIL